MFLKLDSSYVEHTYKHYIIFIILKKRLCKNKVSFCNISKQDMHYLMISTGQVEWLVT